MTYGLHLLEPFIDEPIKLLSSFWLLSLTKCAWKAETSIVVCPKRERKTSQGKCVDL